MRDFDEMLHGSFDAHAGEIDRAGGPGAGLAARTVRDVRRKRAWRAGATGAIAASAVVGVVATALAFGGDGGAAPAAHKWFIDDPYSLGPCTSYIPANAAVLPDGWYQGRAYVDPVARFVVAVMPDGTVTRVQPGPDGDFPFDFGAGEEPLLPDYRSQLTYPLVDDYFLGGGGGDLWVDARSATWQWTVEPLAQAPTGVSVTKLYHVFTMTLGFGGANGYEPTSVPDGAEAETVAIYADGHEVSGALVRDSPAPHSEDIDLTNLEAVALRVTLADGQVWEIRADYTPEKIPELTCQPMPPSGVQLPASPPGGMAPQSGEPGSSAAPGSSDQQAFGDPLSGPESAVFQCGAPLPAVLQDSAYVQARIATGDVSLGEPDVFDVGADGLVIEATMPLCEVEQQALVSPAVPGWTTSGSGEVGGPFFGSVQMVEVVALRDGVIVAAASDPVEDWTAGGVGGSATSYRGLDTANLAGGFISAYNGIHGLLKPCVGAAPDALDGAQLAVVYGFGPDADNMTYGWTSVAE